jgi:hypothetical protein
MNVTGLVGTMLTTAIIKTCKKCGGPAEHVATLPHGGGYEIYQCPDCKSVEWAPLNSGEPINES